MSPLNELDRGINALPMLWRGILIVGLPSVLCVVLILKDAAMQFGWTNDAPNQRFQTLIQSHAALHSLVQANNRVLYDNQKIMTGNQNLMMALCLNSANDVIGRDRCLQANKK
jgi:hypothetical protein